jgi:hypothetical protein
MTVPVDTTLEVMAGSVPTPVSLPMAVNRPTGWSDGCEASMPLIAPEVQAPAVRAQRESEAGVPAAPPLAT